MSDDEYDYDYGDDPISGDDYGPYSDDEWKQDIGDAPPMQAEYKDRERAGGSVSGCWLTGPDGKALKTQDAKGRFCLKVDAFCRNFDSSCNSIKIPEDQIQYLLNKSLQLNRIEFKNPTAYVLGYLVTAGGQRDITKTSLENVWKCYSDLLSSDETIKQPDIIRYARLWMESDE